MNTLIRILEISISFASYNVLPTHYCFIIAQQHSTPQFKAQQQQHPNGIFLGQTKLFHRFALRKYVASRSLNRKRSLYVVLCEDQKSPPNKHLGGTLLQIVSKSYKKY